MRDFNELCKEAERLSPAEYGAVIFEKTAEILFALNTVTGNGADALGLYAAFLMGSVCADGKIDEAEYALMLPLLKPLFGEAFDYAAAKEMAVNFRSEGRAIKKAVNDIVDLLGELDDKLKEDIIIVSLLICAVDGKITLKEKNYIKQLIR